VDVTPQVAGEVIEKHPRFFSGEFIKTQQVLFRIDPTDYELARNRAADEIRLLDAKLQRLDITETSLAEQLEIEQDRLELAKSDLQRAQELIRRGAATQTELENAQEAVLARRFQVAKTQQMLEEIPPQRIELQAQRDVSLVQQQQAEKDLERTVYRSPFVGRVIQCPLEVGERVQAGQECGTIYATGIMEVPVSLPASDLAWIDEDLLVASDESLWVDSQTGQAPNNQEVILAEVVWQAGASAEPLRWYGCVSRIEAGLAAETRTATVVVKVVNPPPGSDRLLLDINMFCLVTIQGRQLPAAFVLPREAVRPIAGEAAADLRSAYVYLVNSPAPDPKTEGQWTGQLANRRIRIARYTDGQAMVLPEGGLVDGDRVILGYVPKPVPGMQVRFRDEVPVSAEPDVDEPDPQED